MPHVLVNPHTKTDDAAMAIYRIQEILYGTQDGKIDPDKEVGGQELSEILTVINQHGFAPVTDGQPDPVNDLRFYSPELGKFIWLPEEFDGEALDRAFRQAEITEVAFDAANGFIWDEAKGKLYVRYTPSPRVLGDPELVTFVEMERDEEYDYHVEDGGNVALSLEELTGDLEALRIKIANDAGVNKILEAVAIGADGIVTLYQDAADREHGATLLWLEPDQFSVDE